MYVPVPALYRHVPFVLLSVHRYSGCFVFCTAPVPVLQGIFQTFCFMYMYIPVAVCSAQSQLLFCTGIFQMFYIPVYSSCVVFCTAPVSVLHRYIPDVLLYVHVYSSCIVSYSPSLCFAQVYPSWCAGASSTENQRATTPLQRPQWPGDSNGKF